MPRALGFLMMVTLFTSRASAEDLAPLQKEIHEAVEKGLALVQKAALNYPKHRDCFSCHHQTLPMLAMVRARDKGLKVDGALLQEQADFTLESFLGKRNEMAKGSGVGGGALTVGYALWALDLAGRKTDDVTECMVDFLLKTQRANGHWGTGNRPPLEESAVTTTALAAVELDRFAWPERRTAIDKAVAKARDWIKNAPMKVREDRTSRLWGLAMLRSDAKSIANATHDVEAEQNEDGGWSSTAGLPSDAYATGQTLARLLESGSSAQTPLYIRGLRYLLRTRQADGSWKVETRSKPIQVYFDNDDPHGRHQFISTPATAWAVVALTGAITETAKADPKPFDVLIRGGTIVDGTGNPAFRGDVGIREDKIVAVGSIPESIEATRVIDARGRIVAPGFIDIHSHSDMPLLEDGSALSKVTQGVTTEVLGEDTSGGPAKGKREPGSYRKGDKSYEWTTLGGYFDALEKSGTAVNVASYVGLGTLLGCVAGDVLDRPTSAQLEEVKTLLDEALNDGAFGLSTMLASPRELKVTTKDLIELGKVVKKHEGLYSSHIRNEGTEVFAAVEEAIAVGENAGIPVDIIHLKIAEQSLWGRMNEIVSRIDDARRRGVNVQANVYPYTRGNNDLVSIIPPWAHEGGTPALLARLRDPGQRQRIKAEIKNGLPGWYNHYTAVGGDWSRMLLSARLSPRNAKFQGKAMKQVLAEKSGEADPKLDEQLDHFLDFLIEENGSVSTIYAHHTEQDMNLALGRPWCSIGSDGSAIAIEGPLRRGHPHPRSFGTFPRVLGVYVRQRHLLSLEDAVRKMTSLNAAKLGILDRGLLRVGQFADVVVFDPETIVDRSTYLEPFHYSEGVDHVLVNGRPVLERGKPTGQRPGRAIRHKQSS